MIEYEVHQFLLYGVFAAIDFVDEEENCFSFSQSFIDFFQFVMNGIDGRTVFDGRQAADFAFL